MKNKKLTAIVGTVVGILLIAGVMFFVFKDNGSDQVVELPAVEEQVIEEIENTNQFAQDIVMRAESEPEVIEEPVEEAPIEEEPVEEQTSIVVTQDVDSTDEEDTKVADAKAEAVKVLVAAKEEAAKKKENTVNVVKTPEGDTPSGGANDAGTTNPAPAPKTGNAAEEAQIEALRQQILSEAASIPPAVEGSATPGTPPSSIDYTLQ